MTESLVVNLMTELPPRTQWAAVSTTLQGLLAAVNAPDTLQLHHAGRGDWKTPSGLLDLVARKQPDLVVTWRNLAGDSEALQWDVGPVVHALTQGSDVPVLLLPDPHRQDFEERVGTSNRVLVVTDHLTGDDRLVNWAVAFTAHQGHLHLAHIEDQAVFEHYMEIISRLPGIPTEEAREGLLAKLLALPEDYCDSVTQGLTEHGIDEHIVSIVTLGNPVSDYPALVERHRIELLVCNTKDPGQQAMDALAHALAVALHDVPLLLL